MSCWEQESVLCSTCEALLPLEPPEATAALGATWKPCSGPVLTLLGGTAGSASEWSLCSPVCTFWHQGQQCPDSGCQRAPQAPVSGHRGTSHSKGKLRQETNARLSTGTERLPCVPPVPQLRGTVTEGYPKDQVPPAMR